MDCNDGCVLYASCLSSSCLFVMLLIFTCSMDMPVAHGVLIGLCVVFFGVGVSFACLCVWLVMWCGSEHLHTPVRPGVDSTSPAKSKIRFAGHRTGNLASKTKKSDTVGAFGKAGKVDTICISLLRYVGPTS